MALVQNYAPADTVTLGAIGFGITTATLSATEWTSISGIREGYRIIETATGGGEAILIANPQFQSFQVEVNVIKPFISPVLTSGNWILRVRRERNIGVYVPPNVQRTKIIPEYLSSLQDISIDEIQDAIVRMRNLRRWSRMDAEYLDVFLQTMGMFLNTEQFNEEDRRRLVKELPNFIEISGTEHFLDYFGFALGAIFFATELWTKDYKEFVQIGNIPVGEEDLHYPTNHVDLDFDAIVFGSIPVSIILSVFYQLASVPLIIERINQQFIADNLVIAGTIGGYSVEYYTGVE